MVSTGSGTGYISKALLSSSAPAGGSTSSASGTGTDGQSQSSADGQSQSTASQSQASGGSGYISGVGTTISGDDGNTYTINTGSADISTSDGLYSGLYVNVGYSVNDDGSMSASAVTG